MIRQLEKYLKILIVIMSIGVTIIPMGEYIFIPTPEPEFLWNGEPFRPVGVNYYPATHPWTGTWEKFNGTELREDLLLVKELGGNCIRTFIQWRLVEPQPWVYNATIIDRIVQFFEIASEVEIAIQFSFFDFGPPNWAHVSGDAMYNNATLIAHQIAQLEYVIPLINHTTAAFMWDLRNEATSQDIPMEDFIHWVGNLTQTIRDLGDIHYIVVGGGYGNFENPAAYAHLVDAVCMHFYQARTELHWKKAFQRYSKMFREAGKPVILQEFGWPSYGEITEEMQAEFYRGILELVDQEIMAGIMAWCLWEYPNRLWNPSEEKFGLLRADGSWKPAAYVFHDYTKRNRQNSFNYNQWEALF